MITDLRPTASLLDLARWLTVDPGSKMAPREPRVLQDDYYKTSGCHEGYGNPEATKITRTLV